MISAILIEKDTGREIKVKAVCGTEESAFSPVWQDGDGRTYGRVLCPKDGYEIRMPWEICHE